MYVRTLMLLAVVFLGLVILYLGTWDRWNWAKLTRGMMVAVALLAGGIVAGIYWSSLPPSAPVADFWAVSLGASKADVRFLKGDPAEIIEPDTWVYAADRRSTYYLVFGDADDVVRIRVVPQGGFSSGVSLLGVRAGFDADRLVDRLGEPSRIIELSGDLQRAYLYAHLECLFILEQGRVVSFGIYDPEAGEPAADTRDREATASRR